MKKSIAFLGIGAMALHIARNAIQLGYQVSVYNRSENKRLDELKSLGASVYSTAGEAASAADIVIAMVTDDEASENIWFGTGGAASHLKTRVALDCSTLSVDYCASLQSRMKEQGCHFLFAPVVGTLPQAEQNQLVYLLSGDKQAMAIVETVLDELAGKVLKLGGGSEAMALKLAINSLFGIQMVAFAELYSALLQSGFRKEKLLALLPALPVTSPIMQAMLPMMAEQKFDSMFPIRLVAKDFGYAEKMVKNMKLDGHMVGKAREVFTQAAREGYANDNITGIIQMYQGGQGQ